MSCHSEVWPTVATFDAAYPILINFRQVQLKCLRLDYDATSWHLLHNMASTGPVWPVLGNGGQLWTRISSLIDVVHFKAELRDLGIVYQVIACTAVRDNFGEISSKVAYNGALFVTVSRYDRLGPYLSLHNLFWGFVIFNHVWWYFDQRVT